LTMDPPPLPPRVEPAVAALVMQLLQKTPAARIQTAAELMQRIDALSAQLATSGPLSVGTPSPSRASVELGDTVLHVKPPVSVGVASTAAMSAATTPSIGATWARLTSRISALGNRAPDLTRNIRVGGQPVPLWAIVGTGGVLLIGGLMFVVGLAMSADEADPPLPSHAGAGTTVPRAEKPPDPELVALIERAESGDRTALATLQGRPEKAQSSAIWRALARGQAKIQSFPGSVSSYKQALSLDGRLASDPQLWRDVRAAAEVPESADAALALLATLGQKGADLLFDVWETHRKTANMAPITKVAKQHLETNAVRAKASPALLVLLDLWLAKSCGSYKTLLSRVSQFADERAVGKLKSLQSGRGCGFLGFGDCFPCLRGNKDLSNALKAAESRPAPALF
jgi:hypothetical protein